MKKQLLLLMTFIVITLNAQFTENFDSYTIGNMDNQNINLWNTWSGTYTDTPIWVTNNLSFNGTQSGYIGASDVTDALLLLDNKTTDSWALRFKMYVPTNKESYFNIQGLINASGASTNEFLSGGIFFNKNNANTGVGIDEKNGLTFSFPHDSWFEVVMFFDLNNQTYQLKVNNTIVNTTPEAFGTGITTLGAVDFYSVSANTSYWVDDIQFYQPVPTSEKNALIALYNANNGVNWINNNNWNTDESVGLWNGVGVNNGHVTSINLPNNNLTGVLPTEIGNFPELITLFLYSNHLSGSIPTSIGNLTNLENLAFVWNYTMTGSIPNSITNLTNLQALYLSDNLFSGTLPNLSSLPLQTLWINNNNFEFADFENEVNSYITNITNFNYVPMNKLETEDMYNISIGSTYNFSMPAVSGTGVAYQWYKNDLPISGETGLTYSIVNAQISDAANYTCKASSTVVPDLTIDRHTIHIYDTVLPADKNALISLYNATDGANWNDNTNWNTAAPIYQWYGVGMEGNRVVSINLEGDHLNGYIPNDIGNLNGLKILNLSLNILTTDIPTQIGNLTSLEILNIRFNQISGSIPTQIGALSNLKELRLHGNQFTGNIPSQIGNLTNLEFLNLSSNTFVGNVPSQLGNLTNVVYFDIEDNQLTGNIPSTILNLPNIENLYLYHNQLTGDLDVSNLTTLKSFTSGDNLFTSIDIRTGNNSTMNFAFFNPTLPNLSCIFVDDTIYSNANWTLPSNARFVETQTECDDLFTYVPDDNFEQALINLGYDDVLNNYVLTSNIDSITFLDVNNKNINDLTGIEDFIGLQWLDCETNLLTNLDVSQNLQLQFLNCGFNLLTSINIDNNINLVNFYCYVNQITSLNVNQNVNLNVLYFSNNPITTINTGQNTLLEQIYCQYTSLTNLDLSQNSNLHYVYCVNTLLTELNVRNGNNINFTGFNAENNPSLTCVFVDDTTWSTTNWTNIDATATFVETQTECNAVISVDDNSILDEVINIYPNPVNNFITIETTVSIKNIELFNVQGKRVLTSNTITNIDISNLASGIYLLKANTDTNSITKKIVIE